MTHKKDFTKGIKIQLEKNFLIVKETLSRIGLKTGVKELTSFCYILHKNGEYYLLHEKELQRLDGQDVFISKRDYLLRNTVAIILESWNLIKIDMKQLKEIEYIKDDPELITIKHKEVKEWDIIQNYEIGTNTIINNDIIPDRTPKKQNIV